MQFDADGNLLTAPLNGTMANLSFDSRNRLIQAGTTTYRYDSENQRISVNQTRYIINSQPALSQVLIKESNGIKTFYVYGLGLIGEEINGQYRVYHFDFRGSTVALTNETGQVTQRFQYATYGELVSGDATQSKPGITNYNSVRGPDFINFQIDIYVVSGWLTYNTKNGSLFVGRGLNKICPSSLASGINMSFGWLNACGVTPNQVDNFLGGYAGTVFGAYRYIGGSLMLSPGNGTATLIGIGVSVSAQAGNLTNFSGGIGEGYSEQLN